MQDKELKQLMTKDVQRIRDEILSEQGGLCKLCEDEISEKTGVSLDHQHRTKTSVIGENGGGLVRGVLCRRCNVMEGKIWNASKRFGIHDNLSDWLRTLADYLDADNYHYIHPTEKPKEQKVSKRNYNKLAKLYKEEEFIPKRKNQKKKPMPEFPKSGKLTKALGELFKRFDINPYN
jgi:hypothetical protein